MADIGAVDRVELSAERIELQERGRVHPVVRLAAEIVGRRVEVDPILLLRDFARAEIVEIVEAAGQVQFRIGPAVALLQGRHMLLVAVFLDEVHQELTVELLRAHVVERREIAPLPMLHQIAEQLRAPADAAFEEGEAQFRKAPRHTTEEDALRRGMPRVMRACRSVKYSAETTL